MNTSANIRKAAVLLRSLDAETAALMLGQLSTEEATSIRAALRELGPLDDEEQADVVAEFRSVRPAMNQRVHGDVELALSSTAMGKSAEPTNRTTSSQPTPRFDFLATASTNAVVSMLVREHAQTVAVVLAHLTPERAAEILGALPERLQADTMERLSVLGETDPESVTVIERELGVWLATRADDRGTIARRRESATKILAAADPKTRRSVISKLSTRGVAIAEHIAPVVRNRDVSQNEYRSKHFRVNSAQEAKATIAAEALPQSPPPAAVRTESQLRIEFDQLIHFDSTAFSAVLREVEADVLALALVGSREELVDRVTAQMPKRTARVFRRALRKLGPTKLSDVEGAQRIVADAAGRYLMQRRQSLATVGR
jgi:flagellar motor switch protein FliG